MSLPFETTTDDRWTMPAHELRAAGRLSLTMSERGRTPTDGGIRTTHPVGECPRCGHHTDRPTHGAITVWMSDPIEPPEEAETYAYCRCQEPHPGRPGSEPDAGCGARWRMTYLRSEVEQR